MKVEVDATVLNAIYKDAENAEDERDTEMVNILVTRIMRAIEDIAKSHPGAGIRIRINRRRPAAPPKKSRTKE
jgi:hypothetical protein